VIQVLPPDRKHPFIIDLKFSKNSGMQRIAVEYSVKILNFLMKQVNNFILVLSNIHEKFGVIEIMKTSSVFEINRI
jgi:hypothetical protein